MEFQLGRRLFGRSTSLAGVLGLVAGVLAVLDAGSTPLITLGPPLLLPEKRLALLAGAPPRLSVLDEEIMQLNGERYRAWHGLGHHALRN